MWSTRLEAFPRRARFADGPCPPHLRGTILDDRGNGRDVTFTSHTVVGASAIRVDGDGTDVRAPTVAALQISPALPGNGPNGASKCRAACG